MLKSRTFHHLLPDGKSTEVLITFFAFFEVASAYTITIPDAMENGVLAEDINEDIIKSCIPAPFRELAT